MATNPCRAADTQGTSAADSRDLCRRGVSSSAAHKLIVVLCHHALRRAALPRSPTSLASGACGSSGRRCCPQEELRAPSISLVCCTPPLPMLDTRTRRRQAGSKATCCTWDFGGWSESRGQGVFAVIARRCAKVRLARLPAHTALEADAVAPALPREAAPAPAQFPATGGQGIPQSPLQRRSPCVASPRRAPCVACPSAAAGVALARRLDASACLPQSRWTLSVTLVVGLPWRFSSLLLQVRPSTLEGPPRQVCRR